MTHEERRANPMIDLVPIPNTLTRYGRYYRTSADAEVYNKVGYGISLFSCTTASLLVCSGFFCVISLMNTIFKSR